MFYTHQLSLYVTHTYTNTYYSRDISLFYRSSLKNAAITGYLPIYYTIQVQFYKHRKTGSSDYTIVQSLYLLYIYVQQPTVFLPLKIFIQPPPPRIKYLHLLLFIHTYIPQERQQVMHRRFLFPLIPFIQCIHCAYVNIIPTYTPNLEQRREPRRYTIPIFLIHSNRVYLAYTYTYVKKHCGAMYNIKFITERQYLFSFYYLRN